MKNRDLWLAGTVAFSLILGIPDLSYAQTAQVTDSVFERVERLKNLHEEDPAAYRKIIQEKRDRLKQNFDRFSRDHEGTAYAEFRQREAVKKRKRLEYMREHNPQGYENFIDRRINRFQEMESRNPERFHQFMEKHPKFQERFRRFHGQSRGEKFQPKSPQKQEKDFQRPDRPSQDRKPEVRSYPEKKFQERRSEDKRFSRLPGPSQTRLDPRKQRSGQDSFKPKRPRKTA